MAKTDNEVSLATTGYHFARAIKYSRENAMAAVYTDDMDECVSENKTQPAFKREGMKESTVAKPPNKGKGVKDGKSSVADVSAAVPSKPSEKSKPGKSRTRSSTAPAEVTSSAPPATKSGHSSGLSQSRGLRKPPTPQYTNSDDDEFADDDDDDNDANYLDTVDINNDDDSENTEPENDSTFVPTKVGNLPRSRADNAPPQQRSAPGRAREDSSQRSAPGRAPEDVLLHHYAPGRAPDNASQQRSAPGINIRYAMKYVLQSA